MSPFVILSSVIWADEDCADASPPNLKLFNSNMNITGRLSTKKRPSERKLNYELKLN